MEAHRTFLPLLIVMLLAFIVPLVLSRFRQFRIPIVVGEILAGIIVGRSGLGLVAPDDPTLSFLAEIGFVFLMFLSGMEIDFSSLGTGNPAKSPSGPGNWGPVPLAALSFVITLALSAAIGQGLTAAGLVNNPWMMALILSTTSLGVVVPVLKESGLTSGRFVQTVLVAALIADFATMLLITVVVAALSQGLTYDTLLISVLFIVFFLVYHFGALLFNRIGAVRRTMEELSHATAQIKVRAAFALMFIFVVLSDILGTEVILGAFLAGAIFSLLQTPEDAEVSHQLETIGFGFLIPIFFINVGMNFNLSALFASPAAMLLVPILLLAAIIVKFVAALVFRLSFSWQETLAAGAMLSARLSLIIAASAIGVRIGVISESVNAAIILVAIITVTAAPLLFNSLLPARDADRPWPILVIGAGDLGLQVAERLRAHNEKAVIIDNDISRIARARQHGLEAVAGSAVQFDPQVAPYFDRAGALICTHTDTDFNFQVCQFARTHYGIDHLVAQVSTPGELPRFERLGVTTMNAALDRAGLLVLLARNPAFYDLLTRTDDNKEVLEVVVESATYVGRKLRELSLPGDVLVLSIRRSGEFLVPHGNTQLAQSDHLTLVGTLEHVDRARQMFVDGA